MAVKSRRYRNTKKSAPVNHLDVTESLGYQTHRKNSRKSWSKEDDEILKSRVDKCLQDLGYVNGITDITSIHESIELSKKIPWESIARDFEHQNRKAKDLKKRWSGSLDPNVKKGKWTPDEDAKLLKAYEKYGSHWLSISLEIEGRTEDQCAKRYIEVLRPDSEQRLREWSKAEDLLLISKVKLYGTKWRKISSEMESRPSLTCRNRWRKIITMVVRGKADEKITKAVKENKNIDITNGRVRGGEEDETQQKTETNTVASTPGSLSQVAGYNDYKNSIQVDEPLADASINLLSLRHSPAALTHLSSVSNAQSPVPIDDINTPQGRNSMEPDVLRNIHKIKNIKNRYSNRPSASRDTEWKFTLKDGSDLSLSNGTISSLDLVKELVDQAKKFDLKISIHQHIHNHYITSNEANPSRSNDTTMSKEASQDISENPNNGNNFRGEIDSYGNEFLSQSPNFNSFDLGTSPQPNGQNTVSTNHFENVYASKSPPFASRPESASSRGSRSTPTSEIRDLGPNRINHFNFLPLSVRPQLGSSDATRMASLTKLLNPSSDSSIDKRRKRSNPLRKSVSYQNDHITYNNPAYNSNTTNSERSSDTPIKNESVDEEEDLNYWESLRTLAGKPASETSDRDYNESKEDEAEEDYGIFFDIFENRNKAETPKEEVKNEK
ncbi:hypothetical protein Kpol_304p5 [Vanderwaltozyma polyspora DSM 70294]|uniref:Myb-like DNA-binding protein BAS1 n=1 Tax=Vanderwaltozyma polyspora (strain ATCC 22028 / DSM 70294 / BCRC 21397 / CBS 2163 / NBRC 10782 / NRRL Y-8283 / UCD 57-17) TaxID=436907 RepID=A7TSZ7_VANPO|nr:uncharacterized protein Kpol_304p5 [Vanderwaltozyma polyspora DSM 70294]EDO14613.1 hypothetical protein Kpol_304p5 [Vanderwaltozyma polyspora DSM 70294]